MARIVFQTGEVVNLSSSNENIVLGKEAQCDVRLPYRGISRMHARIVKDANGQYCIKDLGSSNGTLLNGVQLPPTNYYFLQDGDVISFGGQLEAVIELDLQKQTIHDFLQENSVEEEVQEETEEFIEEEIEEEVQNLAEGGFKTKIADFLMKFTQPKGSKVKT